MRKWTVWLAAMGAAVCVTACGGKEEAAATAATTAAETTAAEAKTEEAAEAEFSEEQAALAKEFLAMAEAYDAVVDRVNASPALLEQEEFISVMNELSEAIVGADECFEDPELLTDEVMAELRKAMDDTYKFMEEAETLLDGLGGESEQTESLTVPVDLVNQTGVDLYALAISPANDEDWGENLLTEVIADGETLPLEITFTADTLVWDILVQDSEENQLSFMGVDFTDASVDGSRLVMSEKDGEYYAEIVQ